MTRSSVAASYLKTITERAFQNPALQHKAAAQIRLLTTHNRPIPATLDADSGADNAAGLSGGRLIVVVGRATGPGD